MSDSEVIELPEVVVTAKEPTGDTGSWSPIESKKITVPTITASGEKISWPDSDQWLRRIDLTLFEDGDKPGAGSALNLTPDGYHQFQITFQVRKAMALTPNLLTCRVYNLRQETMNKIQAYRQVQLSAGYRGQGNFGIIFQGGVAQYRHGKENAVNSYLEIQAGDGNLRLPYDLIKREFKSGEKMSRIGTDVIKSVLGLPEGYIDLGTGGDDEIVRGYTVVSSMRDFFRSFGKSLDVDFFFDDGKFNAIPRKSYKPDQAIVLTPSTGLIGVPEVTPQGIQIRCLLNPRLKLGGLVKLETKLLSGVPHMPGDGAKGPLTFDQQAAYLQNINATTWSQQTTVPAFTSPTGTYKILFMDIIGETRGNPWYNNLVCVALNSAGEAIPSPQIAFDRRAVELASMKVQNSTVPSLNPDNPPPTRMMRRR